MFIFRHSRRAAFLFLIYVSLSFGKNVTRTRAYRQTEGGESYHRRYNAGGRYCETEQIEYRLTKLEVQLEEKSTQLIAEFRESSRRLQALESQSSEVQRSLEGLRNELGRLTDYNHVVPVNDQQSTDGLESKLENLARGVQLVVAALRGLNSDVAWIKKNISLITDTTGNLLQKYNDLTTKQFLTNSHIDVKHHHQSHNQIPTNVFWEQKPNSTRYHRNCQEIKENGNDVSGIYLIQPQRSHPPFMVLCDMDTRGGGWTYIQNRYDGSQDFFLRWHDYKTGFGNMGGEFWLGLEHINQLTGHEVNELLVELVDAKGEKAYAHYAAFSIGAEFEGYALKVLGGYSGDAGDSLIYHAGSQFSTKDLDEDSWVEGNCAQAHGGAWWYRQCDTSNLNGRYLPGELPEDFIYQGMYWAEFRGAQYSLAEAKMMVRPRQRGSPPVFPQRLSGKKSY